MTTTVGELVIPAAARLHPGDLIRIDGEGSWSLIESTVKDQLKDHPHAQKIDAYLRDGGITPEVLRYASTHESLCRHWIFDLLNALADMQEQP